MYAWEGYFLGMNWKETALDDGLQQMGSNVSTIYIEHILQDSLLAPTGALYVMMCHFWSKSAFSFSLSPTPGHHNNHPKSPQYYQLQVRATRAKFTLCLSAPGSLPECEWCTSFRFIFKGPFLWNTCLLKGVRPEIPPYHIASPDFGTQVTR